jgi:hypothetical protein
MVLVAEVNFAPDASKTLKCQISEVANALLRAVKLHHHSGQAVDAAQF